MKGVPFSTRVQVRRAPDRNSIERRATVQPPFPEAVSRRRPGRRRSECGDLQGPPAPWRARVSCDGHPFGAKRQTHGADRRRANGTPRAAGRDHRRRPLDCNPIATKEEGRPPHDERPSMLDRSTPSRTPPASTCAPRPPGHAAPPSPHRVGAGANPRLFAGEDAVFCECRA